MDEKSLNALVKVVGGVLLIYVVVRCLFSVGCSSNRRAERSPNSHNDVTICSHNAEGNARANDNYGVFTGRPFSLLCDAYPTDEDEGMIYEHVDNTLRVWETRLTGCLVSRVGDRHEIWVKTDYPLEAGERLKRGFYMRRGWESRGDTKIARYVQISTSEGMAAKKRITDKYQSSSESEIDGDDVFGENERKIAREKMEEMAALAMQAAQQEEELAQEKAARETAMLRGKEILLLTESMVKIPSKDFLLCKYEVTQAQWAAVMGDNPSKFKGENRPVEQVSWMDCQKFIEKLNADPMVKARGIVFRLPTEGEWEYACRAGSEGEYCKFENGEEGMKDSLGEVAWYVANSKGETHPVGQKKPNDFGLYDMHGNVNEWTSTIHDKGRVCRGGSWIHDAESCSAHVRRSLKLDTRNFNLGLRLAAERAGLQANSGAMPTIGTAIQVLSSTMVSLPERRIKVCRHEVTQALWMAVMGSNPAGFIGMDRPVENVSWNQCQVFIEKLNALPEVKKSGLMYRLPTEEEWEYACRGGSGGDYCKLVDGTEVTPELLDRVAWYINNGGEETHFVGQKEPNAFGFYDMHGNVWEWTATADGGLRVARGGGWCDQAFSCTVEERLRYYPSERFNYLGFRLAADVR